MAEQQEGEWTLSSPSEGQVVQFGVLAITASLAAQNYAKRSDVTYEALNDNGDIGPGATQLAPGNHTHPEYQTRAAAQGAVGSILGKTATIDFSYHDGIPLITADVRNSSITNGKLTNVASGTLKGRISAETGNPEDLTAEQVRTLLNVENRATAAGAAGDTFAVLHPGSGGTAHANATSAVAGFLSSADKAKLDGIEARATADQTGAEIVAAINTRLGGSTWQTGGGSGTSVWGSVSGDIAKQTDLASLLAGKSNTDHSHPVATWVEEYDYGTNGLVTGEEKRKLSLIEEGAQVNTWRISAAGDNSLSGTVYGWSGSQTSYEKLAPDNSTLYFVTGTAGTTMPTAGRFIVPIYGDGDVDLLDVNFAGTITRVTDVRLLGGTAPTATVTLKVNSRAVSGIWVAANADPSADGKATANNTVKVRDVLKATIAAASGFPTALDITIHMQKDL